MDFRWAWYFTIKRKRKKNYSIRFSVTIVSTQFLFPFSLTSRRVVNSKVLLEAVTYFEYKKMEESYWIGKHLLDQMIKKVLPITKSLYPCCGLLFMFDNANSHSIYTKDTLQVTHINKQPGGQQHFFWSGLYIAPNGEFITQNMSTNFINSATWKLSTIQK